MIIAPVEAIGEVFGSAGARDYLGEPVTVAAHLLQAGALAALSGRTVPVRGGAVEPSYFARLSEASVLNGRRPSQRLRARSRS
jgi:predicted HD phosphohydrolase